MAEKDAVADDPTSLKRRSRRRLVGSVLIALTAVVVLPMVMDSEPKPVGQDVQVRIPSQDGEAAPRGVSGKPAATPLPPLSPLPTPTAGNPPLSAPAAAATDTSNAANATVSPVAAKPSNPPVVSAPAKIEKPVDGDKASSKPAAEKADKTAEPKSASNERKTDEAKALAALEGRPSVAASGQWVVQLGAYQNSGNVKVLTGKIKEMNLPVYSEKFDSPQGARIRVRAGPFASKDAAEKAQARIRKIGVDGPVSQK